MALRNKVSLLLLASVLIAGCSVKTEEISLQEHALLLEKDADFLFVELEEISEPLSLSKAIARAIKYNLDYKVSKLEHEIQNKRFELEQYQALPSVELVGGATHRNSVRASSSRSATTGLQSLESSFSSDRTTRSLALQSSWNLIDSGLTLSRSQSTSDEVKIASERRRKILQTIAREVHILYWKTASAQILNEKIDELVNDSRKNIELLKKAEEQGLMPKERALRKRLQLHKSINALLQAKEDMSGARYELSSLINLDPSSNFTLDVTEDDFYSIAPQINTSSKNLADIALMYRPESREELLQNRIAERAKTQEIISSIPGLEILTSKQYDSNSFLLNPSWTEMSASITQSLIELFTLPKRLESAELQKKISDMRRKAMTAAIITQTYIAHNSYIVSSNMYQAQKELHQLESEIFRDATSKHGVEVISDAEYTEIKVEALLGKINLFNSFVDMWYDYIMLIDTLGIDPVPYEATDEISIESLVSIIKNRHNNLNDAHLTNIVSIIHSYTEEDLEIKTLEPTYQNNAEILDHENTSP